jgi:WhiB family redox-sensing transcriptional regulator
MATIVDISKSWRQQAICFGLEPGLFFTEQDDGGMGTYANSKHAKDVCRQCPVRLECLVNAYENKEEFGIWGGTTPSERRPGRYKQTLQTVKNEIEYLQIIDLNPASRRLALKKMAQRRAKR